LNFNNSACIVPSFGVVTELSSSIVTAVASGDDLTSKELPTTLAPFKLTAEEATSVNSTAKVPGVVVVVTLAITVTVDPALTTKAGDNTTSAVSSEELKDLAFETLVPFANNATLSTAAPAHKPFLVNLIAATETSLDPAVKSNAATETPSAEAGRSAAIGVEAARATFKSPALTTTVVSVVPVAVVPVPVSPNKSSRFKSSEAEAISSPAALAAITNSSPLVIRAFGLKDALELINFLVNAVLATSFCQVTGVSLNEAAPPVVIAIP